MDWTERTIFVVERAGSYQHKRHNRRRNPSNVLLNDRELGVAIVADPTFSERDENRPSLRHEAVGPANLRHNIFPSNNFLSTERQVSQ